MLDRWIYTWVQGHTALIAPMDLGPIATQGNPAVLLNLQMALRLMLIISSGSKKEPRYECLSEAKASHRQRMWTEVSSSAPHFLHSGLSVNLIK
jgi:hypothetical protein